jgi:hypothetical protein
VMVTLREKKKSQWKQTNRLMKWTVIERGTMNPSREDGRIGSCTELGSNHRERPQTLRTR